MTEPVADPKSGALWRIRASALGRIVIGFPPALISPALVVLSAACLAIADLATAIAPRRRLPQGKRPDNRSAAIVIPNWNGRDLLEKYLPSVVTAAQQVPGSEVIVV